MSDQVIPPSIAALVRDLETRLRRVEQKRSPALAQTIIDLSAIESGLATEIVNRVNADALKLNLSGGTLSGPLAIETVRSSTGQALHLVAGESLAANPAGNVTSEAVVVTAEDGFQVWGSPSNGNAWSDYIRWLAVNDGAVDVRGNATNSPGLIRFRGSDGGNDIGTMLDFYAGTYKMGVASSSLTLTSDRYFRFYDGTQQTGLIGDDGFTAYLRSDNTYWTRMRSPNTSYGYIETSAPIFYLNKGIRVASGIVSSHNENLSLRDSNTTVMVLDAADNVNGNVLIYQGANSNYTNAGQKAGLRLLSRSSATEATGGLTGMLFQTTYSTDRHVHARVVWSSGDVMTWRNYENTAWTGHQAAFYTVSSSEKTKARIRTGREERGLLDFAIPGPRKLAYRQLRKLRPVLFDDAVQERLLEWEGCPEHDSRDACIEAECPGADNTAPKEHHCDEYICDGTAERPCWLIEKHVDRPGLIAEEVAEVFPKAVSRNAQGEDLGIDYAVLTVELLNTVQHLLEERDEDRSRLAREITVRRKTTRRLDALEARLDALTEKGA